MFSLTLAQKTGSNPQNLGSKCSTSEAAMWRDVGMMEADGWFENASAPNTPSGAWRMHRSEGVASGQGLEYELF